MKKRVLEGVWVLSIVSLCILGSCNTSKQTEETDTAENMEINPPMATDTTNSMNMDNNKGTDSIRAVE